MTIPDEILKKAGITEQQALVELACGLFRARRLDLWPAAQLAGLSRVEMEGELLERGIPLYEVTREQLDRELRALRKSEN